MALGSKRKTILDPREENVLPPWCRTAQSANTETVSRKATTVFYLLSEAQDKCLASPQFSNGYLFLYEEIHDVSVADVVLQLV